MQITHASTAADLDWLIEQGVQHIANASHGDAYREVQYDEPAADALDKWLCQVGTHTTDASDPHYNAMFLLQCAINRATELVWMDCIVMWDEDYKDIDEHAYAERSATFRTKLCDLAAGNLMKIAENSQWILGGLTPAATIAGINSQPVVTAWNAVRDAVDRAFPKAYVRAEFHHLTPYERFARFAQ